jgi:hypothetical protein
MRRVIQQDQNNGKALEIRLEQSGEKYYVVLAGMTFNLRSGCATGVCEPTGEDEFMCIENDTYKEYPFNSYTDAKNAYNNLKAGVLS